MADDTTSYTEPAKPEVSEAAVRLRAFEDEHFGEDCVRINDKIERGSGSPFSRMTDEEKAHYAALERLVEAEAKVDEASAALSSAQVNCDLAKADVDAATKAADEAKAKADEIAAKKAAKQPAAV